MAGRLAGELLNRELFLSTNELIYCEPLAVGPDGTIYVGNNDFRLHAFNPDGTHKWKYKTKGEIPGSPVIAPDGTIYAYADFKYHAIKDFSPLAGSSWPTMGGNNSRSDRISDY